MVKKYLSIISVLLVLFLFLTGFFLMDFVFHNASAGRAEKVKESEIAMETKVETSASTTPPATTIVITTATTAAPPPPTTTATTSVQTTTFAPTRTDTVESIYSPTMPIFTDPPPKPRQ